MGLKHPKQELTHEFPRGKLSFKKLSECALIKRRIVLDICMYDNQFSLSFFVSLLFRC